MPPEQLRHHAVLTRAPRSLRTGHAPTGHGASVLVTEPPYWSRVPAPCVLSVPEAQGSLPRGATHGTYQLRACCTMKQAPTYLPIRHHTFLFRHHTFLVPEHAVLLGLTAEMSPSYVSVT